DGSYVWNGQPTEIDGRFDSPLDFLAGTPSALALQMSSPALELGFSGSGAAGDSLHLAGGLRVAAPSLSRAIRWLGTSQLTLPDIGAVSLETQIQLVSDRVSFGAAQLDLGGNEARGALEAILPRGGARANLSGTLAFDRLDFGVLSQAIAPTPRTLIDLERPIRSTFIRALDMDLRLSARQATLGRASASEVAATVKMASGVGVIDVGDMAVLGGRGQMRVTLDARADVPTLLVTAGVRDAGVGEVAALANEPLPFASGSAEIRATLRSPAGNWGQILASNRGEFTAEIRNGALQGIDAALLKSAGRHPLDFSVASAGAPFQSIRIKAQSLGTRVRFDDIAAVMQDGEIAASGQFDLRGDGLQIAGNMQSPRVEASGRQDSFTTSQPLRFTLRGEWPKPVMTVGSPAEPI
ncbi:MAG: AsmA-like C-terminal region-containing protein, partial [Methylobacterium sp.]